MKLLSKRERAITNLLTFIGIDYEMLHITQTGLAKGYTDATAPFRDFLRRTGIHDFSLQAAGLKSIKYVDVFGLTGTEPELMNISFQRPATKGGRMFRVSKLAGIKNSLHIQHGDILIFFVRENQLHLANLTHLADRTVDDDLGSTASKQKHGATILTIAKNRILHLMESMPECEAEVGSGAHVTEITDLSGMEMSKKRSALVTTILEELCHEGRLELMPNSSKKYRLCPQL